ncbi:MAG: LytTR family DNA-binding domain-containing protein [Lachnospiraceae bacterium]|nr:LytTR family DNA-binding domain-containing protein [Lachnospiraceae bacterium]
MSDRNVGGQGYRVAVCTLTELEQREYSTLVERILDSRGIDHIVHHFSSSRELMKSVREEGAYHLYLMDMQLDTENGISVARALRQMGEDGALIFISRTTEHAIDGYKVQADDYLLKPVREDLLDESLMRVMKARKTMLIRTSAGEVCPVEMGRVQWVEAFAHKTELHAGSQVYSVGRMLSEIAEMFSDGRFYRNHRSYMVNLDYVVSVDKRQLRLSDGTTLPISRGSQADIRDAMGHRLAQTTGCHA